MTLLIIWLTLWAVQAWVCIMSNRKRYNHVVFTRFWDKEYDYFFGIISLVPALPFFMLDCPITFKYYKRP